MLSLKEAAQVSGESKIRQIDTAELLRHRVYALEQARDMRPGCQ
jgi:hypothetical protein